MIEAILKSNYFINMNLLLAHSSEKQKKKHQSQGDHGHAIIERQVDATHVFVRQRRPHRGDD